MLDKQDRSIYLLGNIGHGHLVRIYHKFLGQSYYIFACERMQKLHRNNPCFKQRAVFKNLGV